MPTHAASKRWNASSLRRSQSRMISARCQCRRKNPCVADLTSCQLCDSAMPGYYECCPTLTREDLRLQLKARQKEEGWGEIVSGFWYGDDWRSQNIGNTRGSGHR